METLTDKTPLSLEGYTPLHFAARSNHLEVCKAILETTEDKNPASNNGFTPLHDAAVADHFKVIQLLIDNGVDRRLTYYGETPIQLAASHGHLRSCVVLMKNFQDILSFFKGIWNHRSPKAVGLIAGSFFAVLFMIVILFVCHNFYTNWGKIMELKKNW